MGRMKIAAVAILLMAVSVFGNQNTTIVRKVKVGDTAILPCLTDDEIHRFQYWQLNDDSILGPWNNDDHGRFRYEIWTGRLVIKDVTEKESGFYRCFSKHIIGSELISGTVELLVKRDWEEAYQNDTMVNTYRAVIGILVLLMLILIGVFAFFIKRRRAFGFPDSKEGSPDDMFPASDKAVYRTTSISMSRPSTSRFKPSDQRSLENAIVETDISTSFSLPN